VVFPEREEGKVAIKGDNTSSLACKRLAVAVNAEILQGNNPGIPSFLCGRERYAFCCFGK